MLAAKESWSSNHSQNHVTRRENVSLRVVHHGDLLGFPGMSRDAGQKSLEVREPEILHLRRDLALRGSRSRSRYLVSRQSFGPGNSLVRTSLVLSTRLPNPQALNPQALDPKAERRLL